MARQEFWHLLIALLRSGSAVLVSTPYMDEAMRFNRVIFMNHGQVLTQGAQFGHYGVLVHALNRKVCIHNT